MRDKSECCVEIRSKPLCPHCGKRIVEEPAKEREAELVPGSRETSLSKFIKKYGGWERTVQRSIDKNVSIEEQGHDDEKGENGQGSHNMGRML